MLAKLDTQRLLFQDETSSTFADNMQLPVHRWFRFSAGFSAQWVEAVINDEMKSKDITLLDPFAGAGTTLLAAEKMGVKSYGVEAHPFVARIARAKLMYRCSADAYFDRAKQVKLNAGRLGGDVESYPNIIRRCFTDESLECLDRLRRAWEKLADHSPESELVWLTIVAVLRFVSHAGTAPWQYVLPRKAKKSPVEPFAAFNRMVNAFMTDMRLLKEVSGPPALLLQSDARTCEGVPDNSIDLVVTSPPYANNYDYADATRLEMCFMREINGWGDLQKTVRQRLVRSCSQHVTGQSVRLDETLEEADLTPIRAEIKPVCENLSRIRHDHGGKKNYHLMIASYFLDLSRVWKALRRVCNRPSSVCFVIGDSAPYGVYVPVIEWLATLAQAAGFDSYQFEKTRDRNVKWKNRKHRVPLCEGRLWVRG